MNRFKEVLGDKNLKQTWFAEQLRRRDNMLSIYAHYWVRQTLDVFFEMANILLLEPKGLIKPEKLSK